MSIRTAIIVGAGIFGTTAALELCRRGWRVHLLDPGPIPNPLAESTDLNSMIRLDYRTDEDYIALVDASLERWREWNLTWPEPLFHETGLLILKRSPLTPGGFEYESYETLLKRGHKLVRLSADEISRRYPAWKLGKYVDGYFNPEGGYVESGRVVAQLIQLAQTQGVDIHERQSFARLLEAGSRVAGVVTKDGSEFKGEKVIMAAGAWNPHLIPSLASCFPANAMPIFYLRPREPEHFKPEAFPVFTADIANLGYFGYPLHPREGVVMVGRQGNGRIVDPSGDRLVTQGEIALMRFFLAETFPALFDADLVRTRLGVHCDTRDGHLWIAADPECEGLVIAMGAGHAFKFAPVLGGLLADATEGRDNPLLKKFRWRPEIG